MTRFCADVEEAAATIIERTGRRLVLGLPLGLGKPVPLVNTLYRRALADPSLSLTILSALTLEKPQGGSPIERAFLEPFVARVYGDCPDPEYARALRENRLPPNVVVSEFFFRPGSMLGSPQAQQHYVSSNYTHAARDAVAAGVNVVAQMVARRDGPGGTRFSLSSNPDTGLDVVRRLRAAGRPCLTVALVHPQLPYMEGDAEVSGDFFDLAIDAPRYAHTLFSTPKLPVGTADFLIGLRASALVRDGGTLQLGIGSLGDAIVHALLLRHTRNDAYRRLLAEAGAPEALTRAVGGDAPFGAGLYGASEMLVDGFMHLHRAGILARHVYDFWALQQLVNEGRCDPARLTPALLADLESCGVRVLRGQDFAVLQHHGVFSDATRYDRGFIVAPDGTRVVANVADPETRRVLGACLGERLRNGTVLNAGFFLGTREFYQWLRDLPDAGRRAIGMAPVAKINQLDLNPRLYQLQRRHARFMNTGLMATLSGAVVSDGLADGRVISGVGGQYNFVAMAHQLETGRSIMMIRAVREGAPRGATSNVVFNYGHTTIPRHLRDIVVTEYGVADLRSKCDRDVAVAMIEIADARFQDDLLAQARAAGKVEAGYRIPDACRANRPERLAALLAPHRRAGLFPPFPLGSDFTEEERVLAQALPRLKAYAGAGPLRALWHALRAGPPPASALPYLRRLGLEAPAGLQARVARRLLGRVLSAQAGAGNG